MGVRPALHGCLLATYYYWDTNPVLCIVAWFVAFGGTGAEGKTAQSYSKRRKD